MPYWNSEIMSVTGETAFEIPTIYKFKNTLGFLLVLLFINSACKKDLRESGELCFKQCLKFKEAYDKCESFCNARKEVSDCDPLFCREIFGNYLKCHICCKQWVDNRETAYWFCVEPKYRGEKVTSDSIWKYQKSRAERRYKDWRVGVEESPMDDSVTTFALNVSKNKIKEVNGTSYRAQVSVCCSKGEASVTVRTVMPLKTGSSGKPETVSVRMRFDKEKPTIVKMHTLVGKSIIRTTESKEAIGIIKKMLEHEKMLIDLSQAESPPKIYYFDTSRLSKVIDRVREECKW